MYKKVFIKAGVYDKVPFTGEDIGLEEIKNSEEEVKFFIQLKPLANNDSFSHIGSLKDVFSGEIL